MQATHRLLYKGFWGRSMDELKRLSNIAIKLEGIKGPSGPYELHSFPNPESVDDCKVMSDADIGGFSTAFLDWVPPTSNPTQSQPPSSSSPAQSQQPQAHPSRPSAPPPETFGFARFHGTISTKLPPTRPEIQRSGYAGFRTRDRPPTIFGKSLWDIDPYAYLALRVRSDGRSYFVNVQTESVVPTDLHQHRLFTKRHRTTVFEGGKGARAAGAAGAGGTVAGDKDREGIPEDEKGDVEATSTTTSAPSPSSAREPASGPEADKAITRREPEWETILIKWNDFVRTNHGFVVEPQTEILRQKVRSVGVGLTDRIEGPFELCISRIWATNDPEEAGVDGGRVSVLEAMRSSEGSPAADGAADGGAGAGAGVGGGKLKNRHGETVSWV